MFHLYKYIYCFEYEVCNWRGEEGEERTPLPFFENRKKTT